MAKQKFTIIRQYARALFEVTSHVAPSEVNGVVARFIALLKKNNKIKQAEAIISEFISYAKKRNGQMEINIESARPLEKKIIENIKKIFGKKVNAEETILPELIGGFRVKTEDKIFDASVRKQLKQLKQQLI